MVTALARREHLARSPPGGKLTSGTTAAPAGRGSPVGPPQLESAERFWRAATYLSVAQLYLRDNFLLERALEPGDMKRVPLGHWGTSPAIAFVYAHLSDFVRRSGRRTMLVVGPGHAAPALYACAYLDGTIVDAYPQLAHGRSGIAGLVAGFAHPAGLDTEISAAAPGVIHSGGELGPALAIAQGAALDDPGVTVACVVGDGELETGPAACAWLGARQLHGVERGAVLPIVNLNGLRMGGRSLLARMSQRELRAYFRGLGHEPLLVGPSHRAMADALSEADQLLRGSGGGRPPVVVVATPKGWSGPDSFDGRGISGAPASHKAPLTRPADDRRELMAVEAWLRSYGPAELFDAEGAPRAEVLRCLPSPTLRLSACGHAGRPARASATPGPALAPSDPMSPAVAVADRLTARAKADGQPRSFRVFSPDELSSNRLGALAGDETSDAVVEVLSEHLCHAWLNGYIQTGRHGLLATYEAFSPIFASMTTQYLKFVADARATSWRAPRASLNLFLTSLGWNNCYTHQNPGFLDVLLTGEFPFVRVYTPVDAAAAAAAVDESLGSRDRLNAIVAGKLPLPVWRSGEEARADLEAGVTAWESVSTEDGGEVDLIVAAAGDLICAEAVAALELIRSELPRLRVRFLAVNEITSLGSPGEYEAALGHDRFADLFPAGVPVILPFPGHASTLARLLFRRPDPSRFELLGFRSASGRSTGFATLVRCGVDRFSLAMRIATTAAACRPELVPEAEMLAAAVERAHARHRDYVLEHGADPPWVATSEPAAAALRTLQG